MANLALFEEHPTEAIVGREPGWIIQYGITLIFVVIVILLTLTWFIRYPDSIYGKVILTTLQPPVPLIARNTGRITHMFVTDGETVSQGKPLLLLENSVDYDQVIRLQQQLQSFANLHSIVNMKIPTLVNISGMGELQTVVNQLNSALRDIQWFQGSDQLALQSADTLTLSNQYRLLLTQQRLKLDTMNSQLRLEARLLETHKILEHKGLIAEAELVVIENDYLNKQLAIKDINIEIELYNIKLTELKQQLVQFSTRRTEQQQQLTTNLINAHAVVMSQIDQWQQQYLLSAPADGKVSFANDWSLDQPVKTGDIVFFLVNGSQEKIGKMDLDQHGAGKVRVGQTVYIALDSYPAVEFGHLTGSIKTISLIPGQQGYRVNITLPEKLTTTYGQQLPFTPNLIGTTRIITEEKRLLERFLGKIFYLLSS